MSAALITISHARDAAYTALWARSVEKFISGFARICLFVPTRDKAVFAPLVGTKAADGQPIEVIDYYEAKDEMAHWAHQYVKMTADLWCPDQTHYCYCDADTIFTQPTTPAAYFKNDKPILLVAPFSRFPEIRGLCWRNSVAHTLGWEPQYETMQWCQLVHSVDALVGLREHIERIHQRPFCHHVMQARMMPDGVTPMNFAEFSTIGEFVMGMPNLRATYHVVEIETEEAKALPRFCHQGWSHHGANPIAHARELADFGRIIG